jgi:8-oxo-dGTP pyrophosphatase MutT (NUDIX family)
MTLLARIEAAQGFAPERFAPFHVAGLPVGWVDRGLLPALRHHRCLQVDADAVALDPALDDFDARSRAMAEVTAGLRADGLVPGWRDEVYGVPARVGAPPLLQIERAAATVFGTLAIGVQVLGHVGEGNRRRLWIARRAASKPTYPGHADVMVAGACPLGEEVRATLLREAEEEAGMPAALARAARPAGVVTYCVETPVGIERGMEYCYDLALPVTFRPSNRDGEVAGFELWPAAAVVARLRDTNDFKTNCAVTIVDFLVRHGHVAPDEPDYAAIVAGLRRWELLGGPPIGGKQ